MLSRKRVLLVAISLLCLLPVFAGQSSKSNSSKDEGLTKLRVEVTAGEKDQPVAGASVYVRFTQGRLLRKSKKIEMNLKTNREGFTVVPDIPHGPVIIQVIAEGWKTFGQTFELTQSEQTIKIKLERPHRWY